MNATTDAVARYESERKQQKEWHAWCRRVSRGLPALASRVFALRDTGYLGCGFHWSMERRLGRVLVLVNDFESPHPWNSREAFSERIVGRVSVCLLFRDVANAEASTKTA